jgi:hypothetical protein
MTSSSGLRAAAPRLIAEFFVIIIGVLGALAADQWVQDREDRELETEYLARLRADVGYDRQEVEFVSNVSRSGLAAIDSLLTPDFTGRASDAALMSAVLLAASARQVDLSRGTWEELVASGRIALLREAEVRLALAEYDRFVREITGFWEYTDNDLWPWVMRRVPRDVQDDWEAACNANSGVRVSLSQSTSLCDFDLPARAADRIRSEIGSDEARGELRLQRERYQGLIAITGALLENVNQLEAVLDAAR